MKLKKRYLKELKSGFFHGTQTGIILCVCFFVGMYLFFNIFMGYEKNIMSESILDNRKNVMKNVSESWSNNSQIIQDISYLCSYSNETYFQLDCINNFVSSVIEYKYHNNWSSRLRDSPKQLIKEGGVCRDYAVFYMSILNNLDIPYEMIDEPKHVYLGINVTEYNLQCYLENKNFYCGEKNGK